MDVIDACVEIVAAIRCNGSTLDSMKERRGLRASPFFVMFYEKSVV